MKRQIEKFNFSPEELLLYEDRPNAEEAAKEINDCLNQMLDNPTYILTNLKKLKLILQKYITAGADDSAVRGFLTLVIETDIYPDTDVDIYFTLIKGE